MLVLIAFVVAVIICLVIIRQEIFRSNKDAVNLLRQLGATPRAIARPYIYRAALLSLLACLVAAGLMILVNNITHHYVDLSSYNSVFTDTLPINYLIILVLLCVVTASFAAATALHHSFSYINQILKKISLKYNSFNRNLFAEHPQ